MFNVLGHFLGSLCNFVMYDSGRDGKTDLCGCRKIHTAYEMPANNKCKCIIWGAGTGAVHKWISHTCLHVAVEAPPSDRLRCVWTSRKIIWLDHISIIVTDSQRSVFLHVQSFPKVFFCLFPMNIWHFMWLCLSSEQKAITLCMTNHFNRDGTN